MSELNQNDDLGMGLPDNESSDQAPESNDEGSKKAKMKGTKLFKKPLSKPLKISLLTAGGLVGAMIVMSVVGSIISPSGPSPEEVRQAEIRRQAQESMANASLDDPASFIDDMDDAGAGQASGSTPLNDFGLPPPRAIEPTRLDTVERNKAQHITHPVDENLREKYHKDQFNEVPMLDPLVREVYIEAPVDQSAEAKRKAEESERESQLAKLRQSHGEPECLRLLDRRGEKLSVVEHDYCLSLVERRVARQAALRSLKYMEQPIEHWIDLKRPIIEVDAPKPVVQAVTQAAVKQITPKAPTIDYESIYYLVDIIGDTAVLRGGNTGRVFEFKEGSKLAYNGVLEKIEGDTVHLRFGQKSVNLALWNQSSFE